MEREGIRHYSAAINELQQDVLNSQAEVLDAVAERMASALRVKRSIILFGTDHSHMLAEEGHFRAKSLAAFVSILFSRTTLHEQAHPKADEILHVFSSGVSQMPVERAQNTKQHGTHIVSMSFFACAAIAPLSSISDHVQHT